MIILDKARALDLIIASSVRVCVPEPFCLVAGDSESPAARAASGSDLVLPDRVDRVRPQPGAWTRLRRLVAAGSLTR